MTLKKLFSLAVLFFFYVSHAQKIDVQHYRFELELSDVSDTIKGKATVTVTFLEQASMLQLQLKSVDRGKGMIGYRALEKGNTLSSAHSKDTFSIFLPTPARRNETRTFDILYMGIPADGLIISKNKWGDRTFFADNWPNRARHWLPCHDVPGDKASVEFVVTAPVYYNVVANGLQVEETVLDKGRKRTHWREEVPLPTKVMAVGVAKFAAGRLDSAGCVPVTAWVYPQDREKGFYDYALAVDILKFFSDYIAPYPYKKLANVQSKTIFGGMENAGTIFYAEETVTGKRRSEDLIAHEIAHQWFGDMVTEKSFAHLWLSEGFATYLADVYIEKKWGKDSMQRRLQKEREAVLKFSRTNNKPVVDSTSDLMDLLNANSYQKGAWVLHMLRNTVGDTVFQKIIRSYYQQYKGSNADTRDFQAIAEKVTGKSWQSFFDQWLYQPGIPKISVHWQYVNNKMVLNIEQKGAGKYAFPLQLAFVDANGKQVLQQFMVTPEPNVFSVPLTAKPSKIILDPNSTLLFEEVIK
ncbi:MAG: M1 family metallopeptidase [Flavisolibacter sp.]|nr:M1 family metallopeptidase [Flavisolibacter sp.]